MSEEAKIAAFGVALRTAFTRFKQEELVIRADYARDVGAGKMPTGFDIEGMLERPTRRFLIDPILRELGWDPDDPYQMIEEARSWSENGDRLYLDYLGLNHRRAPTLLVEAKGADSKVARPPRAADVVSATMAVLISESLDTLKAGLRPSALLAEWVTWLEDLRTYVRSLGSVERSTLRRVVITAGRWLIIFSNPVAAFIDDGAPEPTGIRCYTSLDEIVERHEEIYLLLARRRVTNTLPFTQDLGQALGVLEPSALVESYRGVVVATRMSGGVRREYPTRTIYPAVVLVSGDRAFAVVDYNSPPEEEPRNADALVDFLTRLAEKGGEFERRVLTAFGRTDLVPLPVNQYPFTIREPEIADAFAATADSTAALVAAAMPLRRQLVRRTGERNAEREYVVITGETWFYKLLNPFGLDCEFHSFPGARARGGAGQVGHFDRVADAFTVSDDPQHCEHDDLHGMRSERCHLSAIETRLCCRACVFHAVCWEVTDLPRLPCPTEDRPRQASLST